MASQYSLVFLYHKELHPDLVYSCQMKSNLAKKIEQRKRNKREQPGTVTLFENKNKLAKTCRTRSNLTGSKQT